MTAILWPDVEAALIDYLAPAIAASSLSFAAEVQVGNMLANPRPEYAVTVRNDGGPPTETVFADVGIGVNIWAPTKPEAVDLAAMVTALINGMPDAGTTPFVNATASLGYEIADDSGQPHYYLTASLTVRGSNL